MRAQEQRPRLAGDALDRRAAALAGLALALEHAEVEALAFVRQIVGAHAGRGLDAAGGIAVARDRQQCPREPGGLDRVQVARTRGRVQAGIEQHFRAQVVAHAGQEALVQQQGAQRAAAEPRRLQARSDRIDIQRGIEHVGAEALQEGMRGDVVAAPQLDVGCRIQQDRRVRGFQRDAQAARGVRPLAWLHDLPHAVQLVVGVQRPAAVEGGQQRFAARGDGKDAAADQFTLVAFQPRECELRVQHALPGHRRGQAVGGATDFRAFWHWLRSTACGRRPPRWTGH